VKVVVFRRLSGRRHAGVCRLHARRGSRCRVLRRKLTRVLDGIAGHNSFRLQLNGLPRGAYALTVVAQDDTGATSNTHTIRFRRRRRLTT
jgi:hypothetical protein